MSLTQRQRDALAALIWFTGPNVDRKVTIEWSFNGEVEEVDGDASVALQFHNVSAKLIDELQADGLIECEHEEATGLGASQRDYNRSEINITPKALELMSNEVVASAGTENARYAPIKVDTYEFSHMLATHFSPEEQADLCLKLGLDYEGVVPAKATKGESAQEIVEFMRRNTRLIDLWRAAQELRPRADWASLLGN